MSDEPPILETGPPSGDSPPDRSEASSTVLERSGMRLPRSAYVWAVLLFLSFALPSLLANVLPGLQTTSHAVSSGSELSTQDFETYIEAEMQTRLAFIGSGGLSPDARRTATKRPETRPIDRALALYRGLAAKNATPNLARRVLILRHAAGQPVDAAFIGNLFAAQARLKASQQQTSKTADKPGITGDELAFWRGIYAVGKIAAGDVPGDTRRIEAMHLGFLQDKALADLSRAAGNEDRAKSYEAALHSEAIVYSAKAAALSVILGLSTLAGLALLIVFLVAAKQRDWPLLRRVPTAPLHLGWGDLIDGFLFYLAALKIVGLVAGLALSSGGEGISRANRLLIVVLLEAGVGLLALLYAANTARRRGASLSDLGLTTRGNLLGNVGYGIVAYLATLPLIYGCGALAQILFRHATNLAPNPVIPLLASERDTSERILLFVLASVCAPFFEEFFFRGVLFSGLRTRLPWTTAAVVSALFFASLHPMQDWLPILALGFSLATVREMRQSLVPGMTLHFLQNTLAFVYMSVLFPK